LLCCIFLLQQCTAVVYPLSLHDALPISYRRAGTGHLGHDDHAPADADVDAPARLGGCHLVGPATVAGVDDDLDAVTPHAVSVPLDRKSTRLNSSHVKNSYADSCLKEKFQ